TGTTTECYPDIDGLVSGLPTSVEVTTTAKPGMDSYFTININDSDLAGENIPAWCIDVDRSLGVDHTFVADVYSSTESLPDLFENPENFDLINWIINQQYIGKPSPSGGNYTFGDVQWAIWELIDDVNCVACAFLGDGWSVTKGQEIVDAALASPEAEGFVPDCGQLIAIVLIPQDNSQPIFITLEVPCDCRELECETAFARGENGATCFIDTPQEFDRWGWTIGPITEGDYTYDVYAGAGQCDISKGVLVGTVDVSYSDGNVEFEYNIDEGYTVQETHSYAGKAMFPTDKKGRPTVAPGQYSIAKGLNGEIYIIAHAVVCK
ncbi:thioester domain-containing protein, partial [Muriicola jejuensis]